MIDLHTHLLPGWDDGAKDLAEANRMADIAREDGISTIGLMPHVFRMTMQTHDGVALKARIQEFLRGPKPRGVELFRGAEVHVHADMIAHIKEFDLTINGSNYVFIEFPAQSLPGAITDLVYKMMLEGLIPIISHPERNLVFARSPEILYNLVRQGAIGQVTGQSITGEFGRHTQKAAERFLRHCLVHLIASDAHNAEARPPRLSAAVRRATKIVGSARAAAMVTTIPAAILKNEHIPNWGEPILPK
jgi:protein-tyrosine phosphatase